MSSSGMTVGESIDREDKYDFYAKVDGQDYWELAYLKLLKRDMFKSAAVGSLVVAGIGAVVLVAVNATTTGLPRVLASLAAGASVVMGLVLSVLAFSLWMHLSSAIDSDNRAGRMALRPLAERVRRFALRQEQEFKFLLQIKGWRPGGSDQRQEWALDHARTITTEWPKDFADYQELQASVDYQRVRSYLFDKPDLRHGEGTVLFEQIMQSRQDMWDRVQRSLKRQRAATAIERDKTIGVHEEVTRAEIDEIAEHYRRQKPRPEDEED